MLATVNTDSHNQQKLVVTRECPGLAHMRGDWARETASSYRTIYHGETSYTATSQDVGYVIRRLFFHRQLASQRLALQKSHSDPFKTLDPEKVKVRAMDSVLCGVGMEAIIMH